MKLAKFTLITIISEPVLASQIKNELQEKGSSGITTTQVLGEGSRHSQSGEIPGERIKLECIVDSATGQRVLKHIAEKYFNSFSLIIYSQEVNVLRAEKFQSPG